MNNLKAKFNIHIFGIAFMMLVMLTSGLAVAEDNITLITITGKSVTCDFNENPSYDSKFWISYNTSTGESGAVDNKTLFFTVEQGNQYNVTFTTDGNMTIVDPIEYATDIDERQFITKTMGNITSVSDAMGDVKEESVGFFASLGNLWDSLFG